MYKIEPQHLASSACVHGSANLAFLSDICPTLLRTETIIYAILLLVPVAVAAMQRPVRFDWPFVLLFVLKKRTGIECSHSEQL